MNGSLSDDKKARERIKTEIDKNFFVEAGAGSGKTYSLVQRMVAMVKGGIDVRKICAITFTKAAASEFYSRFHKALAEESCNGSLTAEEKTNVENALKKIDLCFMGTIDSFCNLIISEHPEFAGVPSDSQIKSDKEIAEIYTKELSAIARGEYGEELKEKYAAFRHYNYNGKTVFKVAAGIISGLRNCETVIPAPMETDLDKRFSDEKRELLLFLDKLKKSGDFDVNGSEQRFDTIMSERYLIEGSWNRRPTSLLYLFGSLTDTGKSSGIRIKKESSLAEQFPQFLEINGKSESNKYYGITAGYENCIKKYISELKYRITIDFIVSAVNAISEKLCSEGNLTFFDYMYYLRNMLVKDAAEGGSLIKHIYDRHSYFLIDEFQDTNPMQAEIFFCLTAKDPDPDWKKCVPKPGSLFIVGDPKQSIYRFRNADVVSYLNVKGMFTGETGEVLYLTRNFRSTKPMCDYFNDIFSTLLPENTDNQSKFELIPTDENDPADGLFGGVYNYDIKSSKLFDGVPTSTPETEAVCDIITNLTHNPGYLIKGKGDKSPRMIEYRDFMIITPSKPVISGFTSALRKRGIASKTEGFVSFADCPSLVNVIKIFGAVAEPGNESAVYAALTSEIFGITVKEILDFKDAGGKLKLYGGKDVTGCEKIRSALEKMNSLSLKSISLSPEACLSLIQRELKIFEITGSEYLECYYYAIELLRDAQSKNKITSLKEAAKMLSDLTDKESRSEQERCISLSEKENRVHIANIHKVKGLEAEIVILASPFKKASEAKIRTADTDEGRKNWVFRVKESPNSHSYLLKTDMYEEKYNLELECLQAERVRLRYVAATRARSALIISRDVNKKDGASSASDFWGSLIESEKSSSAILLMNGREVPQPETVSASELYIDEKDTIVSDTESLKKTYEIKRPSMIRVKSKKDDEGELPDYAEDAAEESPDKGNAATIGTIVHRLMEILVSSRNKTDEETVINSILSEFGLKNPVYKSILTDVYGHIQSGGYDQKNGMTKDILGELLSADEVYCEVPFCRKENNGNSFTIWNGVMDVVYRKGESWHIVDYKTNADPDDLDEKYKGQLDAYIASFKELTGNDADALIYHIDK